MNGLDQRRVAHKFIEVIPLAMKAYREEMRSGRSGSLSVPQFRILAHLWRGLATSNKELAEHQGVTVAAMSRMVDQLVSKGYVRRAAHSSDRRQVVLVLTRLGDSEYRSARQMAIKRVARRMAQLSDLQLEQVARALDMLEEALPAMIFDEQFDLNEGKKSRIGLRRSNPVQKREINVKRRQDQKTSGEKRQNHILPSAP